MAAGRALAALLALLLALLPAASGQILQREGRDGAGDGAVAPHPRVARWGCLGRGGPARCEAEPSLASLGRTVGERAVTLFNLCVLI